MGLGPSQAGNGFLVALPAAFIIAAGLGWLLERGLIRFLYKRQLDTLLATWGVGLILEQAAKNIFGAPNVNVDVPEWLTGALAVNDDLSLSYARLFIMGLAGLALCGGGWYLFRTNTGRLVRAVMPNRARQALCGRARANAPRGVGGRRSYPARLGRCPAGGVGPVPTQSARQIPVLRPGRARPRSVVGLRRAVEPGPECVLRLGRVPLRHVPELGVIRRQASR